ncbi:hypothetical protein J5X84_22275 [Streptosporangiaceae bacterium NEAU-GS5]|nr:hypothetical protein [Streptosporangiaceae bacterium NEAU-GS5]
MFLVAFNQCGLELQAPQLTTTTKRRVEIADVDPGSLADDAQRYVAWDPQAVRAVFGGLDPAADYEIEVTYLGEKGVARVQSLTTGTVELHPPTELERGRPTVIRVPVPREVTAPGAFEIAVNRVDGPDAAVSEVRLYSSVAPAPVVTVVGDSGGGLIGSVSNAGYEGLAGAEVHVTWPGGGLKAATDDNGLFTIPLATALPPNRHEVLTIAADAGGPPAMITVHTRDLARGLRELPSGENRLDLGGEWSFVPGAHPEATSGAPTRVPGHVAFDGLIPQDGVATLVRAFTVPDAWSGDLVFFRCDAAYGRAEVYVNGVAAGTHGSGALSFDIDITAFLRPGANMLAVVLTEYTPHAVLDDMAWYAHMSLLGIWRPTCLFRVRPRHLGELGLIADWDPETATGSLRVTADVFDSAPIERAYRLDLTLSGGDGTALEIGHSGQAGTTDRVDLRLELPGATPWSAEVPHLYTLDLVLSGDDGTQQTYRRRIGFRRIEVQGDRLLVNGSAVRMLGVNRHDARLHTGRALTADEIRSDVTRLRQANVNVIRTAHYPPDPRMLDICDELGMYLFDQPPICFSGGFDDHHWNRTNDAANLVPYLLEVTAETVRRDQGHCSVLAWDLGNESRWSEGFDAQLAMVRAIDPTRPTLFSYELNELGPDNVLPDRPEEMRPDLGSYHYPGWDRDWREELAWLSATGRPVILDEYAPLFQECVRSTLPFSMIEIDPGVRDYWGTGYRPFMAEALHDRGCIGGMIWSGTDDVFAIPLDLTVGQGAWAHLPQLDFQRLRDVVPPHAGLHFRGDAEWGLIDYHGRARPELWHVQKMYSPVGIADERVDPDRVGFTLLNRHSHRTFSDLTVTVTGARGPERLTAPPGGSDEVVLEVEPGADRVTFELFHPEGWLLDAYSWDVREPAVRIGAEPLRVETDEELGELTVSGRRTWLRGWPSLHVMDLDRPDLLIEVTPDATAAVADGERVTAPLSGGGWTGTIGMRADGDRLVIDYRCRYQGTVAFNAREAGLVLRPPAEFTALWWRRVPDWSYYPPAHIGRAAGYAAAEPGDGDILHPAAIWEHDATPGGTNDYRSAKRNILAAGATDGSATVSVVSDGGQHVRAELRDGEPVLHVLDWYGGGRIAEGSHLPRYFGPGLRVEPGAELSGTIVLACGDLPAELRG